MKVTRSILRTLYGKRPIVVRNSLLGKSEKESLSSRSSDEFKWYSCGPTVYDNAHLGHARSFVSFDIIRRVLTNFAGVRVNYAMAVTDIDDKILKRASENNECPRALAKRFESRFFEDMHSLNVLPPNRILRVTEHIEELKTFIAALIDSDKAYVTDRGNVYFSVSSSGIRYGQLLQSVTPSSEVLVDDSDTRRNESTEEKKRSEDFALWKAGNADSGLTSKWESSWGLGRPGWHIECSAMAMASMGSYLDMHSGGVDLRFPHHTNEIAIAEAKLGLQHLEVDESNRWSHTWLHGGHLRLKGEKMSKSLKNFISIRDFLKDGGSADSFRVFCLFHRYSSQVEYSEERLGDALAYLAKAQSFLNREVFQHTIAEQREAVLSMHPKCTYASSLEESLRKYDDNIDEALADDFDTPRVLSCISQLIKAANRSLNNDGTPKSGPVAIAYEMAKLSVRRTLEKLGIFQSIRADSKVRTERDGGDLISKELIDFVVQFRGEVRNAGREKNVGKIFDLCDNARDEIRRRFGVRIADNREGSLWTKV